MPKLNAASAGRAGEESLEAPRPRRHAHVPELDGVRGIAILLVIALHWGQAWTPTAAIDRAVVALSAPGWLGVELFFVLSGFLITSGLLAHLDETQSAAAYFGRFYWRRALRIFPLYYAALVLLFLILPRVIAFHDPAYGVLQHNQAWYWLYGVNWLSVLHGGVATPLNTGHFWSLAVEEQFYVAWPLIVWMVGETGLPFACATLWGASIVLRQVIPVVYPTWHIASNLTPLHCDPLMAGAIVAWLVRRGTRVTVPLIPLIVGSVALAVWAAIGRDGVLPFAAVIFAAWIWLAVTGEASSRIRGLLRARWLRWFGLTSYCLYVVHYPLTLVVDRVVPRLHVPAIAGSALPFGLVYAGVLVGTSVVIAECSRRYFEQPILRLKHIQLPAYIRTRWKAGERPAL